MPCQAIPVLLYEKCAVESFNELCGRNFHLCLDAGEELGAFSKLLPKHLVSKAEYADGVGVKQEGRERVSNIEWDVRRKVSNAKEVSRLDEKLYYKYSTQKLSQH